MNDMGLGILLVALASVYAAFAAWRHGNDKRDVVALATEGAPQHQRGRQQIEQLHQRL